jgi:signal transduction histidine kinase
VPGLGIVEAQIRSALTAAERTTSIALYSELLEESRISDPDFSEVLHDFLRRKYDRRPVRVVIGVTSALGFLARYGNDLFPGVPILLSGPTTNQLKASGAGPRFTTVALPPRAARTIEAAISLQPDLRDVVVIAGNSPTDDLLLEEVQSHLQSPPHGLRVRYLIGKRMKEILDEVARLPPRTMILFSSFHRDGAAQVFVSSEAVGAISRASAVPVYGMFDTYAGKGMVGGFTASVTALGALTGKLARAILDAEPGSALPAPVEVPGEYVFDSRELRRWGLAEDRLPLGARVVNRDPAFLQRYGLLLAAVAVILVELGLLAFVFIEWRKRRLGERTIRANRDQIRELAAKLITAQEDERGRIARELHDDTSQMVAALALGLSAAERKLPKDAAASRGELRRLHEQVVGLGESVRRLSHDLHPPDLVRAGIFTSLRAYCEEFGTVTGIDVRFEVAGEPAPVSSDVGLCLYRVAQEALSNIALHSRSNRASVSLRREGANLELAVRDSGVGFDQSAAASRGGLGLLSIEERVRLARGTVRLETSPGRGTQIVARVPCEPAATSTEPRVAAGS